MTCLPCFRPRNWSRSVLMSAVVRAAPSAASNSARSASGVGDDIFRNLRGVSARQVDVWSRATADVDVHHGPSGGLGRLRCLGPGIRAGLLRLLDQSGEDGGVIDRQIRQAPAVEIDAGGLEAVDELAVAQTVGASGGVDPDDPEAAEVGVTKGRRSDNATKERY